MARPDRALAGSKRGDEQIGGLDRDIEQRALAGGEMVRDRGLEQVAEIVELVAVVALEHPPLGAGPAMRILRIDRARRVDVAVGLLRGRDLRDQSVDVGIELRIGRDAQRIRRALDHLVEIGFVERIAGRPLVDVAIAAQHRGGALEQLDAAGQLALLERRRNARGAIDLDARRPELVVQMHGGERHRLDRIVGLALRLRRQAEAASASRSRPR